MSQELSPDLETALAEQDALADPATGLVHLGNGRWYDPALGRPLQPNPMGGPPLLPQALNRYAATPLGQPGVMEAAASGGSLLEALPAHAISALKTGAIDPQFVALGQALGRFKVKTGYLYSLEASFEVIARRGNVEYLLEGLGGNFSRVGGGSSAVRLDFNFESTNEWAILARLFKTQGILKQRVAAGRPWSSLALLKLDLLEPRAVYNTLDEVLGVGHWVSGGLGFGLDFVIAGSTEYYSLRDDPYYSPGQKAGRALIRGGVNAAGSFVGGGAALWVAGSACAGTLVAAPGCIALVFVGGTIGASVLDGVFTEPITEFFVGSRERRLQPLN